MPDQTVSHHEGPMQYLQSRVRSFPCDPLHSAAYFHDLLSYLTGKFNLSNTVRYQAVSNTKPDYSFLYSYPLLNAQPNRPIVYSNACEFLEEHATLNESRVIFLTGSPSPQWLNAIGTRLKVDVRFFQSHMDFLPITHREWYTSSGLPSRNLHSIRLLIPSIVYIGPEGRTLSAGDLHEARSAVVAQLKQRFKSLFGGPFARHGESVVRQVYIHTGDMMVLEQAVSISFIRHAGTTQVLVWSDAGQDDDFVPIPKTSSFQVLSNTLEFCPVFFEKDMLERPASGVISGVDKQLARQPLSVLPSRYGETIDWQTVTDDPMLILQELFHFHSAAAGQYLSMLRTLITSIVARTHPTGETSPTMEDLLHFEYTKSVLMHWLTHFRTVLQQLKHGFFDVKLTSSQARERRAKTFMQLEQDLEYLASEAEMLISLCESGKSTIMSSFSVFESRRAAQESRLVTQLTKATNRITFVFLPISFVTSVFGMNFKQFGQGPLSISIWVIVTVPLLALCIILNEYGSLIARLCDRIWAGLPAS